MNWCAPWKLASIEAIKFQGHTCFSQQEAWDALHATFNNAADSCIGSHPQTGKATYDVPKVFCPIVLLNTLGKLLEKTIAKCLQWQAGVADYLHPCQFGGL